MLNRIWNLFRDIGEFTLSIPWLLCWPVHVWNWAARAEHVPLHRRERLISISFGGFGVLAMCSPILLFDPSMRSLVITLGVYMGPGISAVCEGIKLSQTHRPTLEVAEETLTQSPTS